MANTTGVKQAIQFRGLFEYAIPFKEVAWDVGTIADGNEAVVEAEVVGAALGDFVLVSSSLDAVDLGLTAQVTAADTVTLQLWNNTGGSLDIGTIDVKGVVLGTDGQIWKNL